jgi:hypothetical protein
MILDAVAVLFEKSQVSKGACVFNGTKQANPDTYSVKP